MITSILVPAKTVEMLLTAMEAAALQYRVSLRIALDEGDEIVAHYTAKLIVKHERATHAFLELPFPEA